MYTIGHSNIYAELQARKRARLLSRTTDRAIYCALALCGAVLGTQIALGIPSLLAQYLNYAQ